MNQPTMNPFTRSPFSVGDRIKETDYAHRNNSAATVTEITALGFRYEYDSPISFIPRWGMEIHGGECYTCGFEYCEWLWGTQLEYHDKTIPGPDGEKISGWLAMDSTSATFSFYNGETCPFCKVTLSTLLT